MFWVSLCLHCVSPVCQFLVWHSVVPTGYICIVIHNPRCGWPLDGGSMSLGGVSLGEHLVKSSLRSEAVPAISVLRTQQIEDEIGIHGRRPSTAMADAERSYEDGAASRRPSTTEGRGLSINVERSWSSAGGRGGRKFSARSTAEEEGGGGAGGGQQKSRISSGIVSLLVGSSYARSRYTASIRSSALNNRERPTSPIRKPGWGPPPKSTEGAPTSSSSSSPVKKKAEKEEHAMASPAIFSAGGETIETDMALTPMISKAVSGQMPLSTGAPRKIFSPHNMGHKFAAVDQENFHLLASLPFFQDLPMEKLASIMLTLKHRKYPNGALLVKEGMPSFSIVIVLTGQVCVKKLVSGKVMDNALLAAATRPAMRPGRSAKDRQRDKLLAASKKGRKGQTNNEPAPPGPGDRQVLQVKVAIGIRGSIFGARAALTEGLNTESVAVDSMKSEVYILNVADLRLLVDPQTLVRMLASCDKGHEFHERQSVKIASAVYDAQQADSRETKGFVSMPYPSIEEMKGMESKAKRDLLKPAEWTPPKRRNDERADYVSSETVGRVEYKPGGGGGGESRPASAMSMTRNSNRPASAMSGTRERPQSASLPRASGSRGGSRPSSASVRGRPSSALSNRPSFMPETDSFGDIGSRHLYLSTWKNPAAHNVYTGSKVGSVSTVVSDPPHWEIDIDAITDLTDDPKPNI